MQKLRNQETKTPRSQRTRDVSGDSNGSIGSCLGPLGTTKDHAKMIEYKQTRLSIANVFRFIDVWVGGNVSFNGTIVRIAVIAASFSLFHFGQLRNCLFGEGSFECFWREVIWFMQLMFVVSDCRVVGRSEVRLRVCFLREGPRAREAPEQTAASAKWYFKFMVLMWAQLRRCIIVGKWIAHTHTHSNQTG